MGIKIRLCALAATLIMLTSFPLSVYAGNGAMKKNALRNQTRTTLQNHDRQHLRLRDGSCRGMVSTSSTGAMNKLGNTYGPGDGTGNMGSGPKDGTGYGAPSQR